MNSPFLIEREAEEELEAATLRYDQERPGLGRRFLQAVTTTLDQVRQFPLAGSSVPHVPPALRARWAPVDGFPFHAVYLVTTDAIRILAFAHYRRRPGYWIERAEDYVDED